MKVTELCPYCECESNHQMTMKEILELHGLTSCSKCGKKILLCSMCKVENCTRQPNCFEFK